MAGSITWSTARTRPARRMFSSTTRNGKNLWLAARTLLSGGEPTRAAALRKTGGRDALADGGRQRRQDVCSPTMPLGVPSPPAHFRRGKNKGCRSMIPAKPLSPTLSPPFVPWTSGDPLHLLSDRDLQLLPIFRQPPRTASAAPAIPFTPGQHPEADPRARSGRLRKFRQLLPPGLSRLRNALLRRRSTRIP